MRQTNPCAVSKSLRGLTSFDHCPRPKSLADTLSYLHIPKPFKNSKYIRQGNKRNRTVKQLLAGDREREKAHHEQAKQAMQIDQTPAAEHVFCDCFFTPPTQFQPLIHRASDSSIEAPPSILPPSKYCDITGLHVSFSLHRTLTHCRKPRHKGPYTHPTARLRYHDTSIYSVIKSLVSSSLQK